ncbi:MAG: Metalloprotease [Chlamydiales bacterium]|jgi:Zn-dependent M16 (insulinase) family peptidase|nr:Metalloprotease [Chlamydiales bacterium]
MLQQLKLNRPGATYKQFTLTQAVEIAEINCVLREFTHTPSQARVIHIANDDPENVFCLSFKTWPETSNGIAHILEHTVLCGSKKFPIRDPFFSMIRRSLNTYMNALTGADFTCYPAASLVRADFYNLLEVYLDAVFHPLLTKESFLQEGHRLEISEEEGSELKLEFKGIVFNEMKGAMAATSRRLIESLSQSLFPDLTYGINSGGDPKEIPDLTHEELKKFHENYYHPSRCLFYFYGDMPVEEHLDFLEAHALQGVAPKGPLPPLPLQKRFQEPRFQKIPFPISAEEEATNKHLVGISWLLCPILEQETALALSIIDTILMETDASLLKRELLKSGLATQISAYFDSEISEIPYMLIFKGCKESLGKTLFQTVQEALKEIVRNGIEPRLVESAIHQHELARLEITGDSYPYGLSLFMRCALLAQHGGSPEEGLKIFSLFEALKKRIEKEPRYLEQLIETYLIKNTHVSIIEMEPSIDIAERELLEEQEKLKAIQSTLKPSDFERIALEAKELQRLQEEEEDLDILPKIAIADVPKEIKKYPLDNKSKAPLELFHHNCFTNNITYLDLIFDLPALDEESLYLLRLISVLFSQLGTKTRTYQENLEYMQAHTGGVGASLGLFVDPLREGTLFPTFQLHGKALKNKNPELLSLMEEMFFSLNLKDMPRIKEVLQKHLTSLESSLNQSAMKYASCLSASSIRPASFLSEKWYGIHYLKELRRTVKEFDQEKSLPEKLEQLLKKMQSPSRADLILACDEASALDIEQRSFFGALQRTEKPQPFSYRTNPVEAQGRIITSPVAFTSKSIPCISYFHPDAAAISVAAQLFENNTLHPKVREQGGAYGAGAKSQLSWGLFSFHSYRDPNIKSTLEAFSESVQEVAALNFDEEELEQGKLEVLQSLDSPMSPGSRALTAYSWQRLGKDNAARQKYRDTLLSLTKEDVQRSVIEHIAPHMQEGPVVSFASKELLEKENSQLQTKLVLLSIDDL